MKWKYYPLGDNDPKAREQVWENLKMGESVQNTLTPKLMARFSEARGPMLLIAFESLDLQADCLYKYGSYAGGKSLDDAVGSQKTSMIDSAIGGLVPFIQEHLHASKDAAVVCENPFTTRKDLVERSPELLPWESRVQFYGEEVYHIVTSENTDFDSIESAVRESSHHWATGVCSFCKDVPRGDIDSETFFDTIAANTSHIFTPALDGEGFMVWSPIL